jgi:hypothetical protein
VTRIYHLERGYERMEQKLGQLGADVEKIDDKVAEKIDDKVAEKIDDREMA